MFERTTCEHINRVAYLEEFDVIATCLKPLRDRKSRNKTRKFS